MTRNRAAFVSRTWERAMRDGVGAAAPPESGEALPVNQLARPICFMKSWLSQNSHS